MATNLKKHQVISLVDANVIEFEPIDKPLLVPMDLFIQISSDTNVTIQFQVAKKDAIGLSWTDQRAYGVGEKVLPFSIESGNYNLFAKASGVGIAKFSAGY